MEDRYYIVKFGKFLTFLSIVFMIAIPIMIIHKMSWISSSIKTTGTIVGYMEHTGTDSTRSYAPIFTFRDERSKIKYEIVSSTGSGERPFEIGEAVEVLYDPDDPTDAIIDSFERKWLLVIFLIIMAFITKYLGHIALKYGLETKDQTVRDEMGVSKLTADTTQYLPGGLSCFGKVLATIVIVLCSLFIIFAVIIFIGMIK